MSYNFRNDPIIVVNSCELFESFVANGVVDNNKINCKVIINVVLYKWLTVANCVASKINVILFGARYDRYVAITATPIVPASRI